MTSPNRLLTYAAAGLVLVCGLLFFAFVVLPALGRLAAPASTPTLDLLATLAALTPASAASPAAPASTPSDQPTGKIVFTCQIYKIQASNQICIMNADGSGWRRLTTDDNVQQRYASLAPDGQSLVYAAFREENVHEIYEMTLDGQTTRLTDRLGVLTAPEISPDGRRIVFARWTAAANKHSLWLMNRDGSDPRLLFAPADGEAWDPTWSPDGTQILFAASIDGSNQLWIINLDGSGLRKVTNLPALRGRSDWSPQNQIVTYAGEPWGRALFLLDAAGSDVKQISPGGNSQGPSFSPDGQWVAFTAYFDHPGDIHGCEIYIMRLDGSNLRRLTDNDYCDYQPRWGR